ncbi:MAG: Uma2 family endonuclease [Candidatus Contendobacter sp.]|nr:Uma2 family endonuclease [Candidatus Contendobacter sp.]
MNWQEVCEHPSLQDLPFKIELNEKGQIVMNAVRVIHSLYQGEIEYRLHTLLKGGRTLPECAIKTSKGTKVADVAWATTNTVRKIKDEAECSIAPEICIEILSSSNTRDEMREKIGLYLEKGAHEVWICESGAMRFYNAGGELEHSILVSEFPKIIEIDA